jgi:hypothetical protein
MFRMPLSLVTAFLFRTTTYYFDHKESMPKVASLSTFQMHTAAELQALPKRFAYFRLGKDVSLNVALAAFAIEAIVLLIVSLASAVDPCRLIYGTLLVAIGVAMVFITALIGELIPRYTLPLWELLWAAGLIVGSEIESKLVGTLCRGVAVTNASASSEQRRRNSEAG